MSDIEQYNAIIKIFQEHYARTYGNRSIEYTKRKIGINNPREIRMLAYKTGLIKLRTFCRIIKTTGLIFAFINKLTLRCELLTFDPDAIYSFLHEKRNARYMRSKLHMSTNMSKRTNCTVLTMVRAFNELGYYVRIGTVSHG